MNARLAQKIAFAVLLLATLLVVLPVLVILLIIVAKGASAISWDFLFSMPRNGMAAGGILPAILGTLYLVLGAVIFAVPLGVMAAIYLVEYSSDNRLSRLVINWPSSTWPAYRRWSTACSAWAFSSLFSASALQFCPVSLTLGIMILPVIITSSREALESVPRHFRTVSLSLGASRWQTIRHSVLPHALPGILTGMHPGPGPRGRRDRPHPVHRGRVLSAAPAAVDFRSDHGLALPPLRHLHPGARHSRERPLRHGAGAADPGAAAQPGRHYTPLALPQE